MFQRTPMRVLHAKMTNASVANMTNTDDTADTPTWVQRQARTIGQRIAEVRRERGLSAVDLAERVNALGLDMTHHKMANFEQARRSYAGMPLPTLMAVAAALDVPPLWLMTGDDQMEVLPGQFADTWTVGQWWVGATPCPGSSDEEQHS